MLNYKVIAVIRKELREKLFSKSFILMTLLIPLFMFGILGLQTFLLKYSNDKVNLFVVLENQRLLENLKKEFAVSEVVKSELYSINFDIVEREQIVEYVNRHKDKLLNDELNGIVYIPEASFENKYLEYYSKTPNSPAILKNISEPINKVLLEYYFSGKNFSSEDLNYAKKDIDFSELKISNGKIEAATGGNTIVAFLFTFLLYMSLLLIGSRMMSSVIEEKTSRVIEVLLSSMDSTDLLTGKILGTTITSVLQMIVWLSPLILVVSTSWFMIPPEFIISLNIFEIFYFLFNYLLGLVIFLGLFAATGSMFEQAQDAQQGVWPIMILIMVPFFIALGMISNPENSIAKISSMLPFASIIVMPARMSIAAIPVWQFIISIMVNILTLLAIFPLAGKIYRVGILKTGKKATIPEVIGWLKQK